MNSTNKYHDNFIKLISAQRIRRSSQNNRTLSTEAESDRGRLIYSPAFRRLQQKAQVFSLESNAAVRSRLTHSIEVSQTGRFIADLIVSHPDLNEITQNHRAAFTSYIETACLMHDIGNPPFGHFGESAIKEWFLINGKNAISESGIDLNKILLSNLLNDFIHFDGNPQGLRIVSKLQRNSDDSGLNLTSTTLGSFMKYVRGPHEEKKDGAYKKIGYFSTEADIFSWISKNYPKINRHPFAYIIESADDIAYCLSDIEDAIEKHLIFKSSAFKEIENIYNNKLKEKNITNSTLLNEISRIANNDTATYTDFRIKTSRHLCQQASERFRENFDYIYNFDYQDSLLGEATSEGLFLESLRFYCKENVYNHRMVQKIEYAGYKAIFGLMDYFGDLLKISNHEFNKILNNSKPDSLLPPKLFTLIPKRYIKAYEEDLKKHPNAEWNLRAHLVTDYICGMTDDFAMKTYRELTGIELGN